MASIVLGDQGLTRLRVGVFNGAWNLPIWAAQTQGIFARLGLDVKVLPTKSSGALMQHLYSGSIDLALAGVDNFLAYEQGAGEANVDKGDDLRIVMGGDGGFLRLVSQPAHLAIEQLRGKLIGVDALTTGFAFVVRELLRRAGVTENSVTWLPVGGTETRCTALLQHKCDATLLRLPYDLIAEAKGCNILAAGEELGPYQGTVAATRRRWADKNSQHLVAFICGYARGQQWSAQAANRRAAAAELHGRLELPSEALAASVLDKLFASGGLQSTLRVDRAGFETVLELRARYGGSSISVDRGFGLVDETFLRSAGVLIAA